MEFNGNIELLMPFFPFCFQHVTMDAALPQHFGKKMFFIVGFISAFCLECTHSSVGRGHWLNLLEKQGFNVMAGGETEQKEIFFFQIGKIDN